MTLRAHYVSVQAVEKTQGLFFYIVYYLNEACVFDVIDSGFHVGAQNVAKKWTGFNSEIYLEDFLLPRYVLGNDGYGDRSKKSKRT